MTVEDRTVDPAAAHQVDELEKNFAPPIADSYNNLGAIAGSKSDYRSALQYFEQAAEWNPALPGLDINWGRAAFAAGAFAASRRSPRSLSAGHIPQTRTYARSWD